MPFIGKAIAWALGSFGGQMLTTLGVGFVAYQGADVMLNLAEAKINTLLGDLSGTAVISVIQTCNVPAAISILTGAYAMRAARDFSGRRIRMKGAG